MEGTSPINGRCQPEQKSDLARVSAWWQQNRARRALLCAGCCLALAVPLAYRLGVVSLNGSRGLETGDLLKEPAPLDSFSEPSVACALLEQEASRLLLVYCAKRDREEASLLAETRGRVELAALPEETDEATAPPAASRKLPGSQTPELRSLLALDAQVLDLHLALSRKVLKVYVDQHLWNQFVDRYQEIIRESPERGEVNSYFRCALDCAEKCGRAEELVDVLQRLIQVHPELGRLVSLKEPLADWKAAHPPGPEVVRR